MASKDIGLEGEGWINLAKDTDWRWAFCESAKSGKYLDRLDV